MTPEICLRPLAFTHKPPRPPRFTPENVEYYVNSCNIDTHNYRFALKKIMVMLSALGVCTLAGYFVNPTPLKYVYFPREVF